MAVPFGTGAWTGRSRCCPARLATPARANPWPGRATVGKGCGGKRAVNGRPRALPSRHAVPLTHAADCTAAPGPAPRPARRGLGRAVRAGAAVSALRAAVHRLGALRRPDLRTVRAVVG